MTTEIDLLNALGGAIDRARDDRRTTAPTTALVLDHPGLGLDPADLDYYVDDTSVEVYYHDGPVFTLTGWDRTDADAMQAAAEWLDTLAVRITSAADTLRRQANSLCDTCDGTGLDGPDDRDCKRCQGSGALA